MRMKTGSLGLGFVFLVQSVIAQAAWPAGRYDTSMGRSGSNEPPHAMITFLCAAPETGNAAVIASLGDPGDGGGAANLELIEYDFSPPYLPDIRRTQIELGENDGGAGTRRYPILRTFPHAPAEPDTIGLVTIIDKGNVDDPGLEDFELVTRVVGAGKTVHVCDIGLQQRALSISGYGITTVSQSTLLGGVATDDTHLYLRRWEDLSDPKAVRALRVQAIAEVASAGPSGRITFLAVDDDGGVVSMVVSRSVQDTVGWTYFSRTLKGGAPELHRHLSDHVSVRPASDYRNIVVVGNDLPEMLWRLERCSDWRVEVAGESARLLAKDAFSPLNISCDNLSTDLDEVRARYANHDFATRALGVWSFQGERPISSLWVQ
ncbi:hypothetical protein [Parasphingorhabdus cellanae]|uniref:Uncharacterized protein n=1 Tax=Parasphingorhabdus cellanae TaxID=2806553 RepID=A0ABX7SYW4_9SPHN|nr:hypothetical protein [Parasphingorhabdus cellanae]QTD54469.1 hypothetical protein J4G78_09165 [Parasphingorhabdus cellanae]